MVSRRRFDVKLIDFGRARKITTYEGEKIPKDGTPEFMGKFSLMYPSGIYRYLLILIENAQEHT